MYVLLKCVLSKDLEDNEQKVGKGSRKNPYVTQSPKLRATSDVFILEHLFNC